MSANTKIEWATHTFNPWEGCTKVGPGCDHCYAETRNARFGGGQAVNWGPGALRRRTSAANWQKPLQWERQAGEFFKTHGHRQRVFCASLADVFDNEVPTEWRRDLFNLILSTPSLDWLLLTKRIGNAARMIEETLPASMKALPADCPVAWPWPNVWIGATIVNQVEADRDIPKLLAVPARVRFLSMEPLLSLVSIWKHLTPHCERHPGPLDPDGKCPVCEGRGIWSIATPLEETEKAPILPGLDWVIAGGESGPGARPMHPDWARSLRDQCATAGVPYLFKQWGDWGPFVNEDHYTHGGAEKHAHAWVDAAMAHHGKCWLIDDDGSWSNWTGEPRPLPESMVRFDGGTLHPDVAVMGHHGKKAAGRLLDGIEHNGFPEVICTSN